jgi:hypothetical protein
MDTFTNHQGTLGIELIDEKARDLAWRMFASVRIIHNETDKIGRLLTAILKMRLNAIRPPLKIRKQTTVGQSRRRQEGFSALAMDIQSQTCGRCAVIRPIGELDV